MTVFQENRKLLDSFRMGEREALNTIYNFYKRDIEKFVSSGWLSKRNVIRTGAMADNELKAELLQEIFLRAFSKNARLSYDGIRSYRNYLLTLARNVILNYINARPNDVVSCACEELDIESYTSEQAIGTDNQSVLDETPEEALYWRQCINATRAYVKTLDKKYQLFIQLRFKQELPLLEVARQLNVTRGKARFIENKLGRNLKKHLQSLNLSPD